MIQVKGGSGAAVVGSPGLAQPGWTGRAEEGAGPLVEGRAEPGKIRRADQRLVGKLAWSLSASFDGLSYLRAARPTSGLAVRQ